MKAPSQRTLPGKRKRSLEDMRRHVRALSNDLNILVVDDSRVIRLKVSKTLSRAGFSVDTAENGKVALEKALASPPDVVMLDINMPELNGWDTIREMRRHASLQQTLTIILSSNAQDSDQTYAKSLGIDHFLVKPVADDQLVSYIQDAARAHASTIGSKPKHSSHRILVVDDSKLIRRRMQMALAEYSFELYEASNGEQACIMAEKYRPDLILMDINMPEMDGLEATRTIKANPQLSHTVVIAVTSNGQRSDVTRALNAGMQDYIVKPFPNEVLVQHVNKYLTVDPSSTT